MDLKPFHKINFIILPFNLLKNLLDILIFMQEDFKLELILFIINFILYLFFLVIN